VLHHFRRLRPGPPRGIPWFAPVIQILKDLGRYSEAEIVAAVTSACFVMQSTSSDDGGDDDSEGDGTDRLRYVNPGLMANLAQGEQLTSINPNRPNVAFDPFVQAMMRQVGVALELPYEVLIKHFTASYSAARAALLEAWKTYRTRRAWLTQSLNQPVYERWLIEAVAKNRLPVNIPIGDPALFRAWATAEWIGPSMGQIDELKEAQAAKLRVDEEFSTRDEETARLTGGDWRQKHRQRALEESLRRQDGTIAAGAVTPAAIGDKTTGDEPAQNPDTKEAA
jgi:lambda family phage portal protein